MVRIAFDTELIKKLERISSNLRIKAKQVPEIIEKLCDKVLELNNLLAEMSKNSKKQTFKDLLNQLYYWEKKAIKKEKVMFYIFKESCNNQTIFLKSIIKRLSWKKSCTTQEAQNLIKQLERQELLLTRKSCPTCKVQYRFLPSTCDNCGYVFISQKVSFRDKRLRPRYTIEITEKGISYVKELIRTYIHINTFFIAWYKYDNLSSLFN